LPVDLDRPAFCPWHHVHISHLPPIPGSDACSLREAVLGAADLASPRTRVFHGDRNPGYRPHTSRGEATFGGPGDHWDCGPSQTVTRREFPSEVCPRGPASTSHRLTAPGRCARGLLETPRLRPMDAERSGRPDDYPRTDSRLQKTHCVRPSPHCEHRSSDKSCVQSLAWRLVGTGFPISGSALPWRLRRPEFAALEPARRGGHWRLSGYQARPWWLPRLARLLATG
jgi:hypothetical protein